MDRGNQIYNDDESRDRRRDGAYDTCDLCRADGAREVERDNDVHNSDECDKIGGAEHKSSEGQKKQVEHDLVIEKLLDENCETLKRELADALILPRQLPPVEWLETHVAEIPYSPIAGKFTCTNSPMLRELIEAICSPRVRSVSIIASVQSGKTLAAELSCAFAVVNEPGPILWLTAKDDDAKTEGESRLLPLLENCAPAKDQFPSNPDKKRLTSVFFENGATLWICGANNRRNLQSRTIRWLFGDECWLWPQGRLAEAQSRVAAFGSRGKCVFFSQGSKAGDDCDRKFLAGTQKEWTFACPHCGARQPFRWENLAWDNDAKLDTGEHDFERVRASVRLRCENCGAEIENTPAARAALNASGKFVRMNPASSAENESFHWNALAVSDWAQLAEDYLRAKAQARKGRFEDLAAFYQQKLALAWKDTDNSVADEVFENSAPSDAQNGFLMGADDWEGEGVAVPAERRFVPLREYRTRPEAQTAPAGSTAAAFLRFLTIDVQDGYFVYVVRRWAPGGTASRLLWCGIAQTFGDLADVREKFRVHKSFVFIDAGFATSRVAEWCAREGATAFLGARDGRANWRHSDGTFRVFSPAKLLRAGNAPRAARSFMFSPLSCKDKLTDLRRAGADTWALPTDIPDEYLKQMGAETRSVVNDKPIWLKRGNRANHYWDCETMQVAAAFVTQTL